jgi:hypothetical protein
MKQINGLTEIHKKNCLKNGQLAHKLSSWSVAAKAGMMKNFCFSIICSGTGLLCCFAAE